ncbi:hypothetical protein M5C99_02170 [Acidovorax sp. NCPPB 2350]|nr:hypothetical protein M5C99_02170 [Acidovorax sp. NCPPB 2350]
MSSFRTTFRAFAGHALGLVLAAVAATGPAHAEEAPRIPAIKLYNTPDNQAAFVRGTIPALSKIPSREFWLSNSVEAWQQGVHPAPRRQYVVTMKGELEFKVSDGSTFRLAPGTVLLAEDTEGAGHSWKMLSADNEWVRMYIPMVSGDGGFEPTR